MNNLINGGNRRHFAKGGVSTCRPQRKGIKTTRRSRSPPAGTSSNTGEEGSDEDSPPPPARMLNRGRCRRPPGRFLGTPMWCCRETPQECSHTSVRRLAPAAFSQLRSPEPHSRNSPRFVGRRTGKHPATHPHDGFPLGARRAEDLEVAPRDRGRHRSAVRVKPFRETRERKVLLSDGHISRWGDCWVGAAHVVRSCSGAGYAQLQTTCNLWVLPNVQSRTSESLRRHQARFPRPSVDRASGPTSHVLGQWPLSSLIVILLLDPASFGVLG